MKTKRFLFFPALFFLLFSLVSGCVPQEPQRKIMHANVNCSDFARSKSFYQLLGFVPRIETDVHVVSPEEAAGLHMPPYQLHAAPMGLSDGYVVDLIQWIDPYDPEAPYALVNHLGLSRLSLVTTDLDADVATLSAAGVVFLSNPVTIDRPVANSRVVYFKDPDGTLIELLEVGGSVPGPPNSGGTHITGSLQTTVNCSDFALSRAFYEMFGFTTQEEIEYTGSPELATAMGLGSSFHVREAKMNLDKGSGFVLTKWEDPYDSSPPYAHLNHLGIPRIAIQTTNFEADVQRLKELGIEFYAEPITPAFPLNIVTYTCFEDPDGTVIELVKCNFFLACPF